MANKQVNELVELTSLANDDLFVAYDVSEPGSEKVKKITPPNAFSSVYTSITTTSGSLQDQIDNLSSDKIVSGGSEFGFGYHVNIGEWMRFSLDGTPTFDLVYRDNNILLENLITSKGIGLYGQKSGTGRVPVFLGNPEGASYMYYAGDSNSYAAVGSDGLTVRSGNNIGKITFGGTAAVFMNAYENEVYLKGNDQVNILYGNEAADLRLYYAGTEKLRTATDGISVTGNVAATTGMTINTLAVATQSYVDTVSGSLNTKISNKFDSAGGNISGNVTIAGDLAVNGTTFTVNTETVTAEDNLIVINSAEAGAGVTAGLAGIEVERGTLTNYQFYFDESQDNFRVGVSGTLQAVATREDTPTTSGLSFWNGTSYRMDTNANLTFSASVLSSPYLKATGVTKTAGAFYAGTTDPDGSTRLNYDGYFYATRVYNAIWNDIADYQVVVGEKLPGKCYYDTLEGAKLCNARCQKSVIGIISDTYGMAAGNINDESTAPFAVAGWVLAYVDGVCEPGDVLTNSSNGNLIKMTREEKIEYPERIVAIYKKPEPAEYWGPAGEEIKVNGRHWVKVK